MAETPPLVINPKMTLGSMPGESSKLITHLPNFGAISSLSEESFFFHIRCLDKWTPFESIEPTIGKEGDWNASNFRSLIFKDLQPKRITSQKFTITSASSAAIASLSVLNRFSTLNLPSPPGEYMGFCAPVRQIGILRPLLPGT